MPVMGDMNLLHTYHRSMIYLSTQDPHTPASSHLHPLVHTRSGPQHPLQLSDGFRSCNFHRHIPLPRDC